MVGHGDAHLWGVIAGMRRDGGRWNSPFPGLPRPRPSTIFCLARVRGPLWGVAKWFNAPVFGTGIPRFES